MTKTNSSVEARIASLAISESRRNEAIAYVRAGERLADAIVAAVRFFTPRATPVLSHNH